MDHISTKVVRLRAPEFTDPELLRRNRCAMASPELAKAEKALVRMSGFLSLRDFSEADAEAFADACDKLIRAAQELRTIARGSVVPEPEALNPEPQGAA